MAQRRSGDAAKERRWRELVNAWRQSGQTVREFCHTAQVKESAFYWWKRRLARSRVRRCQDRHAQSGLPQGKPADVTARSAELVRHKAARFLPVQVVMDHSSEPESGVEIHWDNGRSVRLHREFDRQTLVDVLAVLEARPC
jgi:hypothetical protein